MVQIIIAIYVSSLHYISIFKSNDDLMWDHFQICLVSLKNSLGMQAVDPELSQHLKRLGRKDSKTKVTHTLMMDIQ